MSDLIDVTRAGGVATLRLQRPPVNAIAPDLLEQLGVEVGHLDADPEVRVIVVRSGIAGYFGAGADLGVLMSSMGDGNAAETWGALVGLFDALENVGKPTIAALDGHALGGGCELALCCDYRFMVDDGRASIGLTETSLGLIPGAGGTQRLPRLIGYAKALHLILEARRLRAPEAFAIGLVDAIADPADFDAAVSAKAEALARMATRALGLAKTAVREGWGSPLADGLKVEQAGFFATLKTDDASEGVSAFFAKRPPEFRGS